MLIYPSDGGGGGGSGGYAPGDRLWLGHSLTHPLRASSIMAVFCFFSDMHGLILVRYGIIVSTYTVSSMYCITSYELEYRTTQHLANNT